MTRHGVDRSLATRPESLPAFASYALRRVGDPANTATDAELGVLHPRSVPARRAAFVAGRTAAHAALADIETVLAAVASRNGWKDDEAEAALWCTRVLALQQDPRANTTLAAAHHGLMAQAALITDAIEREQFLQSTAWRREIQAASAPLLMGIA